MDNYRCNSHSLTEKEDYLLINRQQKNTQQKEIRFFLKSKQERLFLKHPSTESFNTNPEEGVQRAILHVLCDDHHRFA